MMPMAGILCKLLVVRLLLWSEGGSCYSLFSTLLATLRVFWPSRGALSKPGESQHASSITCGFRDSFGPPWCLSIVSLQSGCNLSHIMGRQSNLLQVGWLVLESGVHPPLSVSWLCEGRSVHAVGPEALFVYMPRDYLVGPYWCWSSL